MSNAVESKLIKAARVASGLTQEQAANIIDLSVPTYIAREKVPKAFTVDELERLYASFNNDGKKIVSTFIEDIFFERACDVKRLTETATAITPTN